jgi:hypothetical protein
VSGIKEWVKTHKKVLIITALSVGATAVTVLVYLAIQNKEEARNIENKIHKTIKDASQNIQETVKEIEPIVQTQAACMIPPGFLDNLTGQRLTASGLGSLVGCSNREINRRIVAAGLAVKCPDGTYVTTELGKELGEATLKTTMHGYDFTNIEWDKAILQLIFSPDELQERLERQKRIKQILAS